MDEKELRLDFAEQECIGISIAYTPACSLYLVLNKGLELVKLEISEMEAYKAGLRQNVLMGDKIATDQDKLVSEQLDVAKLAAENSAKFIVELGKIIRELDEPKSKIIVPPKPDWG